jgi:hypothetical protein
MAMERDESAIDSYEALDKIRVDDGRRRRTGADDEFVDIRSMASSAGLTLKRCSDAHYQLRKGRLWLLNLYPGNQRIVRDKSWPCVAPQLDLGDDDWDLKAVVLAVVKAMAMDPLQKDDR